MKQRWLIGLLATATALTPLAASAQDGGFGERIVREARGEGGGRGDSDRAPRSRHERAAPPSVHGPQPSPQPQPRPRYEQRDRPEPVPPPRSEMNSRWNPRGDDSNAGYPRPERRADRQDPGAPAGWDRGQWRGRGHGDDTADDAPYNDRRHDDSNARYRRGDGGRYRRGDHDGGLGSDIIRDADRSRTGQHYPRYDDRRDRDGDRWNREGRDDRRDHDRWNRHDRYDNHHRWDRNWRHDRRYDWYGHRNRYRNQYRWGVYYSPYRNWNYRRLSIGFSLWPLFYSERYWINDPWQYRLPDVYGPYRWVRYYDDALLIDLRTGEVVDVINNFFW